MSDMEQFDVVIVGAGPAGLAAALQLRAQGVENIVILERETEPGGVPRHCGHRAFGWFEFRRLLTGPDYSRRIVGEADAIECRTQVTVTRLLPGGVVECAGKAGVGKLQARCVLLATGVRETPRSARLVSGTRPWGVMTTGALQNFVYLQKRRPFECAVVVGSEWVSYSALMTLRDAGIKAPALIEARRSSTAIPTMLGRCAALVLGSRLLTGTRLNAIRGREHVEAVEIEINGRTEVIECDGVVFSGEFVPESSLVRESHLDIDPGTGGPRIDQYGRCSDPAFFACGNLLRAAEPSWIAWREGKAVGGAIAAQLRGELAPASRVVEVNAAQPLQYACPQRYAFPDAVGVAIPLHVRATRAVRGQLRLLAGTRELASRRIAARRYARIDVPAQVAAIDDTQLNIQVV